MINRPPTQIELKLEDDLVDYEDTIEDRKVLKDMMYSEQSGSPEHGFKKINNFEVNNANMYSPYAQPNTNINKSSIITRFTPDRFTNNDNINYDSNIKEDVQMK